VRRNDRVTMETSRRTLKRNLLPIRLLQ